MRPIRCTATLIWLLVSAIPVAPAIGMTGTGDRIANGRFGTWGVDLEARDMTRKPGDDFFNYANGAWYDRTPVPPDQPNVGPGAELRDVVEMQVRAILDEASHSSDPASRQLGDFYASWIDDAGVEARGLSPIEPFLQKISAIEDRRSLLKLFTEPGFIGPVNIDISPDPAQPARYAVLASQGGLGMPNRDFYLRDGPKYQAIRRAYRHYVESLLALAGISDAATKAEAIIALESALAESHWDAARSRNIKQIYNPMSKEQLQALAPAFAWPTWLEDKGLGNVDTAMVLQPTAITAAGALLTTVPLSVWKDYTAYHFIRRHSAYLPRAFDEASFAFFQKTLRDVPQERARWKRGVELTNRWFGEAVGRLYVERHFPAESRRQMAVLIQDLRAALRDKLSHLEWMDEATRKEALDKLDALDARIGHPSAFLDYSPIPILRNDLLGNVVRASSFAWQTQLSRLNAPVDRALWSVTPQTINARYDILLNQATFPAAILQAPFFDPLADPAVNYGSIGAIIGHEIGHGFDDQGRQFDASGRIRNWWTATAAERFSMRAEQLRAQYDAYEPLPGLRVNGSLTLGENLGDLGGLEIAYAAYRRHVAANGEPAVLDGVSGDQRFFLAFAQTWRVKMREGQMRELVLTDPHSPPASRVNGVVRNMDAWYDAFDVRPEDKLYLPSEKRVRIW